LINSILEGQLRRTDDSFASRVSWGGLWTLGMNSAEAVLATARIYILARLLLPEHFGQAGIALLVLSVLSAFSQTGFDESLLQRKDAKPYTNVAWTMQVVRGTLLFMAMIVLSPAIAWFFGEPIAGALLRALGFRVLVEAFHSIGAVLLRKELDFLRYVGYVASMRITDFVVTIVTALVMRSAWALVLGAVAGAVVGLITSFALHPYRPHLELNRVKAENLFQFGRWILASSSMFFLFTHADDFFVARFLGASALGFYQMAYTISNLPATIVTAAVSQVAFPAFSQLQDRIEDLRYAFMQAIRVTVFLSAPVAGSILFFSPDVTRLFLGEKWLPMVPALQLLALWGAMRSYSKIAGTVLYAIGRPDLLTKLTLAKLILLATLIWPLTARWGIGGTALAVVLSVAPVDPFAQYAVVKLTNLQPGPLVKAILLPVINTLVVIGVLTVCRFSLLKSGGFLEIVLLAVIGLLIYLALGCFSDKYLGYGIRRTIGNRLKTFEKPAGERRE
jgi:lipopolysaccharide exporter